MDYQQCRYKNKIKKIPVRHINGQSYVFLKDVHDRFPGIRSFICNGKPISFENDEQHNRLEPERIQAFTEDIIDCHRPVSGDKAASGIDDRTLRQILSDIHNDVRETKKNTEILKEKFNTILRETFELAEFTVPRLFIVLPENTTRYNPAHWFHLNYRLHFLCECENGQKPHFAFHEGYKIKQPRKFLHKYGPYLRSMVTFVKCAITVGSLVVPQLTSVASGISNSAIPSDRMFWSNLSTRIDQLDEILMEVEKENNISTEESFQYVEGAQLREIQSFLKKTDDHRRFGNLFRSVTNDGHVRWVCVQHYEERYGKREIQDLQKEFRKLGGEIKEDVAIIQGEASNKLSEMFNVIRKGLPVFSVIVKDSSFKKVDFDKVLSDVSQQSIIHNLELENITVFLPFGCKMKKQDIISKLNDTVRENSQLNIQYSFTKQLSKVDPTLIEAMTQTNSRLVFRMQSKEEMPSLELAGTNESGFILSINEGDEKKNISYQTAIKNILSKVLNITKIHFQNGVISKCIWTSFCEFLTTNQNLQELTMTCRLTLEQTAELSCILSDNRTLKTLHMFNVWERMNELKGCIQIFEILRTNTAIIEFVLTCHTDRLQLDSVARSLLQNKSLRTLRLPKCMIDETSDIVLIENFFRNTSIHTLSLELVSTNCEASLERLAHAVDKNETVETLELNGLDCSAIFHRKQHIPDSQNNIAGSFPAQFSEPASRSKFKQFLALFSCHKGDYRHHSQKGIISTPITLTQINNRKSVSVEPFYSVCNHPSFYKQVQEITENFELEKLQVTIKAHAEMSQVLLSMKSNSTVTELRIDRQILEENVIHMFIQGLRENTTITHLNLNEINISLSYFRQIFDGLRDNRTLRVLEVRQCVSNSDHDLFKQVVKTLELNNPSLKVVYAN